jgi:hypothetical protein
VPAASWASSAESSASERSRFSRARRAVRRPSCRQAAQVAGGIFSKAGLAGMLPGLKSFFGFGENNWTDMGGGRMATGGWISQYGSLGDKFQALGISNAALIAGGLLAMDGLRRGGYPVSSVNGSTGAVSGHACEYRCPPSLLGCNHYRHPRQDHSTRD